MKKQDLYKTVDENAEPMPFYIPSLDFYSGDYVPVFDNLYTIEIYPYTVDTKELSKASTLDLSSYIKYQATTVSFGSENLSLKRHPVTKQFHLHQESYTRSDNLTISWRENFDWKVKKYHEDWLSCFYDRDNDYFISYDSKDDANKALFRTFKITLPKYMDSTKTHSMIFQGVLPSNTGNLSLKWSQNPDVIQHEITYYVSSWYWES